MPISATRTFLAGLAFALTAPFAVFAQSAAIPWRQDLDSALVEARQKGLPVWLQFTGSWCGGCQRMASEVFPQQEVVRRAREGFVPILLAADANEELVERLGITGIPATVILSSDGQVAAQHIGYAPADELSTFLDGTRARIAAPAPSKPKLPIAMAGKCPVTLVESKALRDGSPKWVAEHEGQTYRFVDAEARERFQEDPAAYAPANKGHCPVSLRDEGKAETGNPSYGALYRKRLYLFADAESRERFLETPARYLAPADGTTSAARADILIRH